MLSLAREPSYGTSSAASATRQNGINRYRNDSSNSGRPFVFDNAPSNRSNAAHTSRPVGQAFGELLTSTPAATSLRSRNARRSSGLLRRDGIRAYNRANTTPNPNTNPGRIREAAQLLQNSTVPATRGAGVLRSTIGNLNSTAVSGGGSLLSNTVNIGGASSLVGGRSSSFQGLVQEGIRQYQLYGGSSSNRTGNLLSASAGLYNRVGPMMANTGTLLASI